jgi:hypothetical protein
LVVEKVPDVALAPQSPVFVSRLVISSAWAPVGRAESDLKVEIPEIASVRLPVAIPPIEKTQEFPAIK